MLKAIEIGQSVGVRVLLIHAKDESAKNFYRHYGFVESPLDPLVMMMLLTDDRRSRQWWCPWRRLSARTSRPRALR
jgi:hypothetical protein